jgi:predicted nucleotidyltransferase
VDDIEDRLDVSRAVREALSVHPAVRSVRLIGSRAKGRAHEISDWDFAVETDAFDAVARELPDLVEPLRPLAAQWDPYGWNACYMLMLAGPVKVDLLFVDEPREWAGPWEPSAETLEALDRHFWDWILWLEQKRRGGRTAVLEKGLVQMYELLLGPMGVQGAPRSVADAVVSYVDARGTLESRFGVTVPRELEQEVRPVLET